MTAHASAEAAPATLPDYDAIVATSDRDSDDKVLDEGRRPADMLRFFGITAGMRVADLGAGRGYTTELLARTVGASGVVYGQNPKLVLERYAEKPWTARLSKSLMKHVVRLDRPFDDPLPEGVHDLDAVLIVLFYHDTVWQNIDRDRMNKAVYAALRPGGVYGIVDHSGRPDAGVEDVKTFHRIEEKVVRAEVERVGFRLAAEASFLRHGDDPRDWNDSPTEAGERRGKSDRFVLKYVKP